MLQKTFRNVLRFQVFVPETLSWLKYRRSLSGNPDHWIFESIPQDGTVEYSEILTCATAKKLWHRYKSHPECYTIYVS